MSSAAENPQQIVAVRGRGVVPAGTPVITADDLGFTRGDGVFDATRVVTAADGSSTLDHLDGHLARFSRSIGRIGGRYDDAAWRELIDTAVAAYRVPGEAVLKVMYSNGQESHDSPPTQLLTITPAGASTIAKRAGLRVRTLPRGYASDAFTDAPWLLGGVKTLAYAVNVAVKPIAAASGDDDVLFVSSDGYALEGPTSTLVVWRDGGLVTTPLEGTGVLASVTQEAASAAALADGVSTTYALLTPEEVAQADGAWLLSSVRGVAPILTLDGEPLGHDPALTARLAGWAGFHDGTAAAPAVGERPASDLDGGAAPDQGRAGQFGEPNQDEIDAFWADAKVHAGLNRLAAFSGATPLETLEPPASAWGADRRTADEIVALILDGTKTATSSSLAEVEAAGWPVAEPGLLEIVLDGDGHPRALIATTAVEVVPFDQVGEEFAAAEGEGDRSLAHWRRTHEAFFTQTATGGRRFEPSMPVICQRFEVLHRR